MRALSLTARQALAAQETDEAFLALVTIDHEDLEDPIRVTSDAVDTVRGGEVYLAYPFSMDMPSDSAERLASVTIQIDNVHRDIVKTLREVHTPASVTLEVVLGSDPESLEAGPFAFTLKDASADILVVEGTVAFEDILNEPFPPRQYTPQTAPGIF